MTRPPVRHEAVRSTSWARTPGVIAEVASLPLPWPQSGGFLPLGMGLEVAGVVVATGGDVDDAWVGRRVYAMLDQTGGGYADLVAADVEAVVALPDQVGEAEAVALGFNALTALTSLERAEVREADKVLVRGAGGGVGLMATLLGITSGPP